MLVKESDQIQVFDLAQGDKLWEIQTNGSVKSFFVTLDRHTLATKRDGGLIDLYNFENGNAIGSLIILGGDTRELFYDADCQRVHAWTNEGRVLRIAKGWKFLNKWFRPHVGCS